MRQHDVMEVLRQCSRTFFIPITRLNEPLRTAVASAYLCLRAIDEIEDHESLNVDDKVVLLKQVSLILQQDVQATDARNRNLAASFGQHQGTLPDVTMLLDEWIAFAPDLIAPRIVEATATMADRMAHWVGKGWGIRTRDDLDQYTYAVAGSVGLLTCDLTAWYDSVQIPREPVIAFGRGLQAVNMLRNRGEDMARGVDFFPHEWSTDDMVEYARDHLSRFYGYAQNQPDKTLVQFFRIPRELADATLTAIQAGRPKLTRSEVLAIVQYVTGSGVNE